MPEELDLSVVVPMYNEEQVVDLFFARLRPALEGIGVRYEVVCVDDGSHDRTAAVLREAAADWPELRMVRLVRNAGHQAALSAGFAAARGRYVVTIDSDLQDPPETIPDLLDTALAQGLDVVYAVRTDRSTDTWFKRTTSDLYYRMMRRVAGEQVPHNAGDFRLVSRRVVEAMNHLPEHGRVHRLVIPWFGFPSAEVGYVREERAAGKGKYPLGRMLALAFDSLVAFSAAPLRVATFAGLVGFVLGVVAIIWSVWAWAAGTTVPGWTSILAVTGVIGAIQLIALGLLGEYIARIFTATHRRPTYLVGYDSLEDRGSIPAGGHDDVEHRPR